MSVWWRMVVVGSRGHCRWIRPREGALSGEAYDRVALCCGNLRLDDLDWYTMRFTRDGVPLEPQDTVRRVRLGSSRTALP